VARILSDSPTKQSHPLFAGVLDYLSKIPSDSSPSGIRRKASDAWQEIARLIAFPTRDEVEIFSGVKRSANFGKDLLVPFCIPPSAILLGTQSTTESRVKDALWPSGQIAIEYPSEIVEPLQSKCFGLTSKRSLESFNSVNEHSSTLGLISQIPKVAVITRTLDRPMFLQRALESVNKQTFKDYIHVIVNDGGDTEIVKRVILESDQCDRTKVLLVNHATNRGMEAASNSGIKSCESKYITIHDDDDSWESEFLEKSVAFLEGEKGKVYSGVVAKSMYISETVKPQGIIVHKKFPYQGWIDTIHLTEMSIENFYPPIAFLFRRDIYTKIGGFNESYPVLGDWDFNLRYLMEADIGVIQEYLCNYHHRDTGGADTFKNSVISGVKTHSEYSAIVRNEFVRKTHAERTNLPVVGLGSYLAEQRSNLRAILRSTLSHDTP
jgi:glycosyltransferase involved in cell wall biosynthesis